MTQSALIAELVKALEVARRHVAASNGAEHLWDGFGPHTSQPSDTDLKIVDAALSHAHAVQSDEPDHVYNPDDWEYTVPWKDRYLLVDEVPDEEIIRLCTLCNGPDYFAAKDSDECWHWFRSRDEAESARRRYCCALNEDNADHLPPSKREGK